MIQKFTKYYPESGAESNLFVGETDDIKAMYKSIRRNHRHHSMTYHEMRAKFSPWKTMYGLLIAPSCGIDISGFVTIVSSDTILRLLHKDGYIKEQ